MDNCSFSLLINYYIDLNSKSTMNKKINSALKKKKFVE